MPISVLCPKCERNFLVKDEIAGKSFRCKDCQAIVKVPSATRTQIVKEIETEETSVGDGGDWGYDSWNGEDTTTSLRTKRASSQARSKPADKRHNVTQPRAVSAIPIEAIVVIGCIGALGVLNLWELASGDALVWKLIAVVRLIVEARVIYGIWNRINQTGIAATVAAVMMTVLSMVLLWQLSSDLEMRADLTAHQLQLAQAYFIIQTIAEIGVIVGLNLPRTRAFLSST